MVTMLKDNPGIRQLAAAEPRQTFTCSQCDVVAHNSLRYEGMAIIEYTTGGGDTDMCDDCARDTYNWFIECDRGYDEPGQVLTDEHKAEWKRWQSLRNRRVNAAFKRCGINLKMGKARRARR